MRGNDEFMLDPCIGRDILCMTVYGDCLFWIPAFAGMTVVRGDDDLCAGMTIYARE
jgi:hypothetical protein